MDNVRTDTRAAGEILRYHTWPSLRKQTIANHSWNVWRIMYQIWTVKLKMEIPAAVTEHVMLHDVGELRTGDAPYPIKKDNPELKAVMDRLENESLAEQGITLKETGAIWKWRIKVAHAIEMMEFGIDEMNLGNRYGAPVVQRMNAMLSGLINEMHPQHMQDEFDAIHQYVRVRFLRCGAVNTEYTAALFSMSAGPLIPRSGSAKPGEPLRPGTPEDGGHHGAGTG